MIGSILLSIWIILGIINILIFKTVIDDAAEESYSIITPIFGRRILYVAMMIVSPYYFVKGMHMIITDFFLVRRAKKLLKKSGIDLKKMMRDDKKKKNEKNIS